MPSINLLSGRRLLPVAADPADFIHLGKQPDASLMSRNFPCVASRHRTSCGGKMKKVRKFNAAVALGSLTAAVALLAGAPDASAQTAPGGGSFPGSFLVPGPTTSIKIGGYAKIVGIYDIKGVPAAAANVGNPDVEVPAAIPLSGSAAAGAHGALRFHARQSNINLDSRTPTAYGDLTIFLTADFF